MSKKVLLLSILCLFLLSSKALAQDAYSDNAFRFSQSQLQGSARTLGFAGAQTALGADLGSLSANPAGLGLYRKSEYAFSPNFTVPSSQSTANGSLSTADSRFVLNMNNMGIAICALRDDIVQSKWRGGTFALGLTRTINFQNAFTYQGTNNQTSFADYLTYSANSSGYNWNNYTSSNISGMLDLAYGTYIFSPIQTGTDSDGNPIFSSSQYINLLPPTSVNPIFLQAENVTEKGGLNEWSAGYGGNVADIFYFGGTLSMSTLRYDRQRNFKENLNYYDNMDSQPLQNIMTSVYMDDNLKVRGTGVNLNVGMVVKIGDFVRSGLSFKTPTIMGVRETYAADMSATYANVTLANQPNFAAKSSNPQVNNYTLYTPFQANWGLAVFAGKVGFLSADVQYVDYSTSKIGGSNNTNYINSNGYINNYYQSVINFKVGGEARVNMVRLRAGYALFPTAWRDNIIETNRGVRSSDMQSITGGIGVRTNEFFLDLAISRSTYTSNYSPYYIGDASNNMNVKTNNVLTNVTIGGGIFF